MGSTIGTRGDGKNPISLSYFDPAGGIWVGLLAFAVVYGAAVVVSLYEGGRLSTVPGEILAYPGFVIAEAFWYFNSAHIGAALKPLTLLAPGSLERIPGVLVYLVPPVVLSLAGGVLVRGSDARRYLRASFVRGASVGVGYLAGVLLIHIYLYVLQPYPLGPAVRSFAVVGVAYPVGFGGLGGIVARRTVDERTVNSTPTTRRDQEGYAQAISKGTAEEERTPSSTPSSEETVQFKEVLTPRVPGKILTLMLGFVLMFTVPILALLLLVPQPGAQMNWQAILITLAGFGFFGALWGAGTYYRMRVYVEVTDSGVQVVRNWNALQGAPGVTVPFKEISHVQPSDSIRSLIGEREHGNRPRQTYMVTAGRIPRVDLSYEKGVRVERNGGPPVYIGSEQPAELASAIRTRASANSPEPAGSGHADASEEGGAEADETDGSDEITGSVPGASEKQERRMVISVVAVAVGGILVFSVFGRVAVFPVCGALGAFLFYGGVTGWRTEQRELETFEQTTGTVLKTEVETATQSRRKPLIKYEYAVDGRRYENDKIWPGKPIAKQMSPKRGQDFFSRFPEGEETTVYYDPADPSNAFLVRESAKGWMGLITVVGIGLLMYATMGFLGMIQPPAP